MTTRAEMTLIVARTVSHVFDGVATGGTTTTVVDTSLAETLGAYNSGTVWITQSGVVSSRTVTTFGSNTITFSPALTNTVAAGQLYSVAPNDFPKSQLEQSILEVLEKLAILKVDSTATVVAGADVTLPTGVSDVRQVFVVGVRCNHWVEVSGKLKFDKTSYNGALELRYAASPAVPTTDTSILDPTADPEWLHWAAVTKLWRDYYRDHLKDNPVAIELFNEARQNELIAKNAMRAAGLLAPSRDPRYGNW